MKTILRKATMGSLAFACAVGLSVFGVPDSLAIGRTTDEQCNGSTEYWTTFSTTGNTCWANNGTANVTLYLVALVSSGNNYGYYMMGTAKNNIGKWTNHGLPGLPTITQIVIEGR
jgi:hypothetical protein